MSSFSSSSYHLFPYHPAVVVVACLFDAVDASYPDAYDALNAVPALDYSAYYYHVFLQYFGRPYPQALNRKLRNKWQLQLSLPCIQRMLKCPPVLSSEGSYCRIRMLRKLMGLACQKEHFLRQRTEEESFQNRRHQSMKDSFKLESLLEVSRPEVLSSGEFIIA